MLKPDINALVRWAAFLARASREPKSMRIKRGPGRKLNLEQECARRRRFHERHGTAMGGGPIWENDPFNPLSTPKPVGWADG